MHAGWEGEESADPCSANAGLLYDDWQAAAQDQWGVRARRRTTGGAKRRCVNVFALVFNACRRRIKEEAREIQTHYIKEKKNTNNCKRPVSVHSPLTGYLMLI